MRLLVKSISLAGALCVLSATVASADGVLMVMKVTSDGGAPQTTQVQIDARRMRTEGFGGAGEKQIVIFDGTKKVMILIDESKKTYVEMTEADIEGIGSQMSGMMEQLQKQMASMPPEQRAQMEQMMKGRGMAMPGAAAKTVYTKTGTGTVGKWTCDKYEGTSGGQKVSEVCTVDPKVLGFTVADFDVSRELAAFFKKLMPVGGMDVFSIGNPADQGFSGIPVRNVSTVAGKQVTTEITEVKRQPFPDSVFQAPAGFQKTDFMSGRGRGRGRGGE